ncbi:uncharacterized protein [Spinacia oleracea]|uniref:Reverse transcriptase domain-containing protein n=1 Tax=Spinacia oleracea TaxID=3562 RepID=A0ABM3RRE5_SPIOL|nr:uncharacterized protein LOC130471832 [Spinacia oleracea]
MKLVLPAIISPSQHAFISGRFMSDNILLSHELLDKINNKRKGSEYLAAIKIDMSKAYDRVHWDFLLYILRAYGFPNHWLQLIHQCISTVSYKVLPDLTSSQGIRLTRGCPQISHLFFADDALLFFKANKDSCAHVTNIINKFCSISGKQLNLQKSYFKLSSNTPMLEQSAFRDILPMKKVLNIGSHLGVPIDIMGRKSTHFQFIVDKVINKVTSWNSVNLSQTQKLILINSVLIAMASHILNCMEIPLSISYKVDSILGRFFWANKENSGMHWVRRNIIQLPKGLGGLGIRSMVTLNKALLMRQAWRIHKSPNSLLAKVCRGRFTSPLATGNVSAPTNQRLSWGMRGIWKASILLHRGCQWKIGNGMFVRAGKDKWVNGRVPEFNSNVTLHNAMTWKVNHFILPTGTGWDLQKVNSCFEHVDAREIAAMELPSTTAEDFQYWRFHKSGRFTVKTDYAMLAIEDNGLATPHQGIDSFKILWALKILPKWKLFLWKVLHKGLATKRNKCGGLDLLRSIQKSMRTFPLLNGFFTISDFSNARMAKIVRGLFTLLLLFGSLPNLRFLHPPETDPIYPPGFYRAILTGVEMEGSVEVIQVDGSWKR